MGRPKRSYDIVIVPVKLTLVVGEDDDLIRLFRQVPKRMRTVAVKASLRGNGLSAADALAIEPGFAAELDAFEL